MTKAGFHKKEVLNVRIPSLLLFLIVGFRYSIFIIVLCLDVLSEDHFSALFDDVGCEDFLLGLRVVAHNLEGIAHLVIVVLLDMVNAITFPAEALVAAWNDTR